ncbi:MAG: hypothetical protein GF317_15765 [Candidatus Lokiarchaeota archaeon]|nr:hypothetical protein [Candidatus Lokiarchaeota archaeon]
MAKTIEQITTYNRVVRVAITNNFNCTRKEWDQLHTIMEENQQSLFFVNCNIRTPKLETLNNNGIKAVITMNPEINPWNKALEKIHTINKDLVAFLRVKYLPERNDILDLIDTLAQEYPVVITNQRFNSKNTLLQYTKLEYYKWSHNRFRLNENEFKKLTNIVDNKYQNKKVFICDRLGVGCSGCRLCSFLPTDMDLNMASLNLSSSGICKYNCPDCYAKTIQHSSRMMGYRPITFDTIKSNSKQAGRTDHIKNTLKKLVTVK